MAHAYTPGLKVTADTVVEKVRRLPVKGEVLVGVGDAVDPGTVVARARIAGDPETVNLAYLLGSEPSDVEHYLIKKPGDAVREGEVIARTSGIFGLFKREVKAPVDGTIEHVSSVTGQMIVRRPPVPVEVHAYIRGRVKEVLPEEGVVIEARGAFIQGIFGVGGERQGRLRLVSREPDDVLDAPDVPADAAGAILVGGSLVTGAALARAAEVGAAGVVAGGIVDTDLVGFLGYDIGVAITGHEDIPITVIITEGFGRIRMADRTFRLLRELDGREVSVNGATQIRAGVMRPEIIAAGFHGEGEVADVSAGLEPGTPVRIIREPYFGLLGTVSELPPELHKIETEASVRILRARLADGRLVTVPRANVEILEG